MALLQRRKHLREKSPNQKNQEDETETEHTSPKSARLMEKKKELEEIRALITELEDNYKKQKRDSKRNLCLRKTQNTSVECVLYDSEQFFFEFTGYENNQKHVTYSVQIVKDDGRGVLGKLNMPLGIDFKRIITETPLVSFSNPSLFIKNCKRYIDLYHERKKNFEDMKSYADNLINCNIDTNHNYTYTYLQLMRVHDVILNKYYNVSIYLFYDLADTKPKEIKIETDVEKDFAIEANDNLSFCLKYFETLDPREAFDHFIEDNREIQWQPKLSGEIEYTSDISETSEEEVIEEVQPKSKGRKKKGKKKRSMKQSNQENDSAEKNKQSEVAVHRKNKKSRSENNEKKMKSEKKSLNTTMKQTKLNFTALEKKKTEMNENRVIESSPENSKANDENEGSKHDKESEVDKQNLSLKKIQNKEDESNKQTKVTETHKKSSELQPSKVVLNRIKIQKEQKTKDKTLNKKSKPRSIRKLFTKEISVSTPIQQQSKSVLHKHIKENYDVSDISEIKKVSEETTIRNLRNKSSKVN